MSNRVLSDLEYKIYVEISGGDSFDEIAAKNRLSEIAIVLVSRSIVKKLKARNLNHAISLNYSQSVSIPC